MKYRAIGGHANGKMIERQEPSSIIRVVVRTDPIFDAMPLSEHPIPLTEEQLHQPFMPIETYHLKTFRFIAEDQVCERHFWIIEGMPDFTAHLAVNQIMRPLTLALTI